MADNPSNARALPDTPAMPDMDEGGRLQLATRVAWMYFIDGLRQEDIAEALGLNRMRVNRLISMARELRLVHIEIVSPYRVASELEARLRKTFGLREAIVIPATEDAQQTHDNVGHALGSLLNRRLVDGMTVGTHGGHSTYAMFRGLVPVPMPKTTW